MNLIGFLAGGVIGVMQVLSARWTLYRLRPNAPARALVWVLGGMILRVGAGVAILAAALNQGIDTGALALAGLWLGRSGLLFWLDARQRTAGATPLQG